MKQCLAILLFACPLLWATEFKDAHWTVSYPQNWFVKTAASKVEIANAQDMAKATAKLALNFHAISEGLAKKYDDKKILEMTALAVLGEQRKAMKSSTPGTIEEVIVKRPGLKKSEEELKAEKEAREKMIAAKVKAELALSEKYKLIQKKEATFLGNPAIFIELELVPDKEPITKQIWITIIQKKIVSATCIFPKKEPGYPELFTQMLSSLAFKP